MATSEHESRTLKAKRPVSQHTNTTIGPVAFFFRSESELTAEKSFIEDESMAGSIAGTTYGVQSLEDAMQTSTDTLSRTSSNESDSPRKRRPGNPVHPKIYATGQRIVSGERRTSMSSAPLTPLHLSPHPDASTPRTNSIKSFQLSDDGVSVASDTGSQAIQSSSSEEDLEVRIPRDLSSPEPQLVMPSITMPKRRPFTQRGAAINQMKVLVAGASGLGKTSLIRNMFRLCEDIVHVDGMTTSTSSLATVSSKSSLAPTTVITEVRASSKPLPAWSADERLRRSSYPERLLDRNLRFVDSPGVDSETAALQLIKEIDSWLQPGVELDSMTDEQLLDLLRGRSDAYLDAVLYLFTPEPGPISRNETRLLQRLSMRTNVVPIVAMSDAHDEAALAARKTELASLLAAAGVETYPLGEQMHAISSLADDGDVMDASTLMASTYVPALRPSEMPRLIQQLFEPSTIDRLRHSSTVKLLAWRRSVMIGKAVRPYTSYFRSTSPSSDASGPLFGQSPYSLPRHQTAAEPTRHTRIAKWARDLQRSLRREENWREDSLPTKGRIGGELAIIDPKDPLGILSMTQSFGARGWLALQVVGSCGLITATVWWFARSWIEWHAWAWPYEGFSTVAVPAPTRSWPDIFRVG